jgi:TPR repeat protein
MLFRKHNSATLAACLMGFACFGAGTAGAASSDEIVRVSDSTAEMDSPLMQKAVAAAHRRDFATAQSLLREAAKQGNAEAEIGLARMSFEGLGTAKNIVRSLYLLKNVIEKNREPSRSDAVEALHNIAERLRDSPNPADKQLALIATLLPLTANPYAQQWSRDMAKSRIVFCGEYGCW